MPGAKELSTVEWQSAQVMPNDVNPVCVAFGTAFTPTTALRPRSAMVVFGSVRLIEPFWTPATTLAGSESASTFSPTRSATVGLTPATASFIRSLPVQNASSPKVSKRNVCWPWSKVLSAAVLLGSGAGVGVGLGVGVGPTLSFLLAVHAARAPATTIDRAIRLGNAIAVIEFLRRQH